MSLGDRSFYQYGGFTWGESVALDLQRSFLDAVARKEDITTTTDVDCLAMILGSSSADVDAVAKKDATSRSDVDVFVSRLPTSALAGQAIKPVILVELQFPSGTLRVTQRPMTIAGEGWDGRLVNSSAIERALGGGVDDMRIQVADVDPRISDGFTAANPPEGSAVTVWVMALDDPDEERITLFNGRVERVSKVTDKLFELEIVRADAILDRVIGRLLDTAIEPDAPDESLGRMIPHVYGVVEESEALVSS